MSLPEERMRILKLIESGQVKAEEGAQLLDALGDSPARERARGGRPNVLRVRVTDLGGRRQKINVTIPVGLIDVGVKLGVPAAPLAFQLLFATNYFSVITPQGSSANLLFAGSGFLSQGDLYRLGGLTTAFSLLLYLVVGTPWLRLVVP